MSFLWSTQSLVSETPLPSFASRKFAIELLHDHVAVQHLQPLVTGSKAIPAPPETENVVKEAMSVCPEGVEIMYREVTLAVPLLPFYSTSITCISAFMPYPDGLIVAFQAPMGLYGHNKYTIVVAKEGDERGYGSLALREEARITGLGFLMGFTMGTERENHRLHREAFAGELTRRGIERGGGQD